MEPKQKPLKRHPELVPLSREHHFGLLFGWKIKQGLTLGADNRIIREYVQYFWTNHLAAHFEKEEKIIRELLPAADAQSNRVLTEHDFIRSLINCLALDREKPEYLLQTLHQFLNEHIRFEERELFPYLESVATPAQFELIGKLINQEEETPEDNFQPAFWQK